MFRDASGRAPRQMSETESLFSLIGTMMGNNARQRAEAKDSAALSSLYAPIEPNMNTTTVNDLSSQANPNSNYMGKNIDQQTAQGLLPTGFQQSAPTADMVGQGLLSIRQPQQPPQAQQRFFNDPSIQTDQQPAITPVMGQYAKENNPGSITTKTNDWNGIQKDIQAQGYKRIQELSKSMSPEMFAKYLPEAKRVISEQITQSKGEYDQKVQDNAYASFETETDPKKKIMIGMKAGLIGKEGAMMLIQPDTETKVINTGSENVVVGFSKLTGRYVNLKDGSEIPADELQTMLKPTAKPKEASEYERWKMANGVGIRTGGTGGGGSGGGIGGGRSTTAKPGKLGKEETWALNYESGVGMTNDQSTIDTLGSSDLPLTTSQTNQLQQAMGRRDHYWKVSSGGQYGQTEPQPQAQQAESNPGGAEWYSQNWQAIKDATPGMTDQQATDYMTYRIQQGR